MRKLAKLARLALDDRDVARMVPELESVVAYVDRLREVDTSGVVPMIHGHPWGAVLHTPSPVDSEQALGREAVAQSEGFDEVDGTVRVPKVIE